jgi:hypothetical protein
MKQINEQEINNKIFESLEEESKFVKNIKKLTPLFFSLAISSLAIDICLNSSERITNEKLNEI